MMMVENELMRREDALTRKYYEDQKLKAKVIHWLTLDDHRKMYSMIDGASEEAEEGEAASERIVRLQRVTASDS